jgi:hypothetical protein
VNNILYSFYMSVTRTTCNVIFYRNIEFMSLQHDNILYLILMFMFFSCHWLYPPPPGGGASKRSELLFWYSLLIYFLGPLDGRSTRIQIISQDNWIQKVTTWPSELEQKKWFPCKTTQILDWKSKFYTLTSRANFLNTFQGLENI